jgi:crotonobetainyl-CoA:carnitine CoA-transferase CaiB-like acyl-CoA transferase
VDELEREISPALASATVDEWVGRLGEAGVPAGRVLSLDEVYESEQVSHLGLVDSVEHPSLGGIKLPGSPLGWDRSGKRSAESPPTLGEHNGEVFGDA